MRNHLALVAIAAFLGWPGLALCGNYGFLKGAPISGFTDEDTSLMMQAADDALNDTSPHAKRDWKNAATGNSGQLEVVKTFELADGTPCRRLQVFSKAKSGENRSTHTLCKSADGIWMIRSDAKPK